MDKTIRITELITVCVVIVITMIVMLGVIYEGKKILTSDGNSVGPIVKVEIDGSKTTTWDYTIADSNIIEVNEISKEEQKKNITNENGEVLETQNQMIDARYSIMPLKAGRTTVSFRMMPSSENEKIETKTYDILVSKVGINSLAANIIE